MSDHDLSSSDIEREIERQRADVSETIDTLRDRLSPKAAADYGVNYLRGPGGRLLLGAVRDNPLAALLAIAGLGWLFYAASRPKEERRSRSIASGTRYPAPAEPGEPALRERDPVSIDDVGLASPVVAPARSAAASPATPLNGSPGMPSRVSTSTPKVRVYEVPQTNAGSGTSD